MDTPIRQIATDTDPPAGIVPQDTLTLANAVHELVRSDIITTDLAPGTKLALDRMCRRYGIGSSPMREALTRLAEEGLVERRENRGFAVAAAERDGFSEIVETRCRLETMALSEAIARGGREWEDALVVAHHRLARHPRSGSGSGSARRTDLAAMHLHDEFHAALLSACGSSWLIRFCRILADQGQRHRRALSGEGPRIAAKEHEAILDATLARDAATATQRLAEHHRATLEATLGTARPARRERPDMARRRPVP